MLVLPLDSLRRCECQPTPPMLWLRSDSRLVWHLLVGGCFLSLGGGWWAAVGGPQGMGEAPRGATMLPGEQRGRAGSLVFGSHAERGCCLGRLGDGGGRCQLHPPPQPQESPKLVPPAPKGRSSRRRSCSSCLGLSLPGCPSPEAGLEPAAPCSMGCGETMAKGRSGPGGTALLPAPRYGVPPLGRGSPCMWDSERRGAPAPIAPADPSPMAPSTMQPAPGATCPAPLCTAPAGGGGSWAQLLQAVVGGQRASTVLPSSPVLAGHSSNSRIVWEHTRGRYTCMQCPYSTASREEMTLHIEDHRKNPPPPGRLDTEMGTARAGEVAGGTPQVLGYWWGAGLICPAWTTRTQVPLSWRGVISCWGGCRALAPGFPACSNATGGSVCPPQPPSSLPWEPGCKRLGRSADCSLPSPFRFRGGPRLLPRQADA